MPFPAELVLPLIDPHFVRQLSPLTLAAISIATIYSWTSNNSRSHLQLHLFAVSATKFKRKIPFEVSSQRSNNGMYRGNFSNLAILMKTRSVEQTDVVVLILIPTDQRQ